MVSCSRKRLLLLFGFSLSTLILIFSGYDYGAKKLHVDLNGQERISWTNKSTAPPLYYGERLCAISTTLQGNSWELRRRHVCAVCSQKGQPIPEEYPKFEKQFQSPKDRIRNGLSPRSSRRILTFNTQYRIGVCLVPKSGTWIWAENFLRLKNISNDQIKIASQAHGLHKKLRDTYLRGHNEYVFNQPSLFRLIVVRHPFARLISSFRDKIVDLHSSPEYAPIRRDIMDKAGVMMQEDMIPTFSQFVNYLLSTPVEEYNKHWLPISLLCQPCTVNYNVVIRLENIREELPEVLNHLGLKDIFRIERIHTNGNQTSENLMNHFRTQLTSKQLQGIKQIYKWDFLLFNYTLF